MKLTLKEFLADIRKGGKLKIVCGICKRTMQFGPDDNLSHGECEPCCTKKLWMAGLPEEDLTEFVKEHNPKYTPVGGGGIDE